MEPIQQSTVTDDDRIPFDDGDDILGPDVEMMGDFDAHDVDISGLNPYEFAGMIGELAEGWFPHVGEGFAKRYEKKVGPLLKFLGFEQLTARLGSNANLGNLLASYPWLSGILCVGAIGFGFKMAMEPEQVAPEEDHEKEPYYDDEGREF